MTDADALDERTDRHARDLDLARRTLAGDASAQDEWVSRMECVPAILSVVNRRMGSPLPREELLDLAQDCLCAIWRRLETFEGRATLETWAHRFCVLEYMNRLRRRRSAVSSEVVQEPSAEQRPLGDYQFLQSALDHLGPPESDILRLKHFEELTFAEIGDLLRISPNTAKTRYYRGLVWLRNHLSSHQEEA